MIDGRWLTLEGAHNVRDLGGLPTVDGRTTRTGVVLRADALDGLSAADTTYLIETVGLRHVIDLRSASERGERGRGPLGEHRALAYTEVEVIPIEALGRRRERRATAYAGGTHPDRIMADGYRELLDLGAPAFRAAADVIASDGGVPALFHCAAGKDRTGVFAALLLDNAGVEHDAIVADYTLTDERMPSIIERLTGVASFEQLAVQLPVFTFQAKAGTMAHFLEHLRDERGGAAGYLAAIGVDDATIGRLRARLRRLIRSRASSNSATALAWSRSPISAGARPAAARACEPSRMMPRR